MKNSTLFIFFLLISAVCFAAPPVVSGFAPASAEKGTMVIITGSGFVTGATVSFGGTPAAATVVVSPTQINAVVAAGSSGSVAVTVAGETGSLAGFTYLASSRLVTSFGGYWSTTTAANNPTIVNNAHDLLAFQYGGAMYSTGVNDAVLNSNGVSYTAGNFRALPVAGIAGTTAGSGSVYLALAELVDGTTPGFNLGAVSGYTVKTALTDGTKGLNLGTGVTNLPTTAILTFPISIIDGTKVADNEPDIILTQIAQPSSGTDAFSFRDALGNVVGNTVSRDMNHLDPYGTYRLDLYSLASNTSYNTAAPAGTSGGDAETRDIRLVGLRLADFGITSANVAQVKSLRVTPGGNSDYAFIAYNATAIFLAPNVSPNQGNVNTNVCTGNPASLSVVATPANNGALSYQWQESTNNGSTWTNITNGGIYSGATSSQLNIASPTNGYQYQAIVTEAGNPDAGTSSPFTITINPPSVGGSIAGSTIVTYGTNTTTLTLSGQTGNIIRWQSSTDGFASQVSNISNTTNQLTTSNLTQTTNYRVQVQSGACAAAFSNLGTITVSPLPIRVGSVKLSPKENGLQLQWTAYDQDKTALFEVERSTDGITYTKVYSVPPTNVTAGDVDYIWLDANAVAGINFYRVKEVYHSGYFVYSDVVTAPFENNKPRIVLQGNPVKNRTVQFQMNHMRSGNYLARFINNLGQMVGSQRFSHTGNTSTQTLPLPGTVKGGVYKMEITAPDKQKSVFNLIVM